MEHCGLEEDGLRHLNTSLKENTRFRALWMTGKGIPFETYTTITRQKMKQRVREDHPSTCNRLSGNSLARIVFDDTVGGLFSAAAGLQEITMNCACCAVRPWMLNAPMFYPRRGIRLSRRGRRLRNPRFTRGRIDLLSSPACHSGSDLGPVGGKRVAGGLATTRVKSLTVQRAAAQPPEAHASRLFVWWGDVMPSVESLFPTFRVFLADSGVGDEGTAALGAALSSRGCMLAFLDLQGAGPAAGCGGLPRAHTLSRGTHDAIDARDRPPPPPALL